MKMCFRIFAFIRKVIKTCIYIAIDAIVFFICSLSDFIESLEWPFIQTFYGIFKVVVRKLFEKNITYSTDYDDEAIRKGNAYIDELLRYMFDDFDPYEMDDNVIGFYLRDVLVNVSGEAKLHDGDIKGLRTLHRSGDCILEENGEKLKVKADLGAGVLNFYYAGSAKFMNFGPTITVEGELAYIEVSLEFTVDTKTGKNGKLTKFVIDDMRGMKIWISGLGPINWAMNPIISGVTKIFKRFVRNFIENKVRAYISDRIPNYQFPVEGRVTEAPSTSATSVDTSQPQEPETSTSQPETDSRRNISTRNRNSDCTCRKKHKHHKKKSSSRRTPSPAN